jgi:hypothetical protein
MDISASHCRTASFTCTGVQDPHGLVQFDGRWFCLPLKQLPSSDSAQVVSGCCTAVSLTRTSHGWEFYSHAVYASEIGLLLRQNGTLEIYEEGARGLPRFCGQRITVDKFQFQFFFLQKVCKGRMPQPIFLT